jgi:hypothetical protein
MMELQPVVLAVVEQEVELSQQDLMQLLEQPTQVAAVVVAQTYQHLQLYQQLAVQVWSFLDTQILLQ